MTSERIFQIANMPKLEKLKEVNMLKSLGGGNLIEAKIMCQNRFDLSYEFVELYNLLCE